MVTVATVLKSGGDYGPRYVRALERGVRTHLSRPHHFVCLTDLKIDGSSRPLRYGLPGWWSKIELFDEEGPILCLDLDTVVVGDLEPLIDAVEVLGRDDLMMLRGFHVGDWTSGIMGWSGSHKWLADQFREVLATGGGYFRNGGFMRGQRRYRGDQEWIREAAIGRPIRLVAVQDSTNGIYSYKVHIRQERGRPLPADARLVCFHGQPRPPDVRPAPGWLEEAWAEVGAE